jgi:hypothetical protein
MPGFFHYFCLTWFPRNLVENALSSQSEQHMRLPSEMETEEVTLDAEIPNEIVNKNHLAQR